MHELTRLIREFSPTCAQEAADKERMLQYIALFPHDILTRENPLCHFTASGWITDPARSKVLMIWHNIYRSWSWTGGHADGEADLLGVALREAREETGLVQVEPVLRSPVTLEIITVPGHVKRGAFVSPHLHLNLTFLLCAEDSQPLRPKSDENSGVAWFTPEEAEAACTEVWMRDHIYRKLNEKLRTL
ncbi:MAG: NUDIX hydrolase [Eubacteriales bacterium]|nr:NUDIX hydrolase [Eubacteriales bacterium]